MMKIGQNLPNLTLPRDGGDSLDLSSLRGQKVVLFFYPRDNTPGCTKEAIGFSELKAEFESLNTIVIGVSKDDIKSHDKFVLKQNLTVPILSDIDTDLCEQMGVWKEKSMYGKTYMGIERSTFIIDETGKLTHEWRKVKVPGHVDDVLSTIKAM